jgi:hypothetical protein
LCGPPWTARKGGCSAGPGGATVLDHSVARLQRAARESCPISPHERRYRCPLGNVGVFALESRVHPGGQALPPTRSIQALTALDLLDGESHAGRFEHRKPLPPDAALAWRRRVAPRQLGRDLWGGPSTMPVRWKPRTGDLSKAHARPLHTSYVTVTGMLP